MRDERETRRFEATQRRFEGDPRQSEGNQNAIRSDPMATPKPIRSTPQPPEAYLKAPPHLPERLHAGHRLRERKHGLTLERRARADGQRRSAKVTEGGRYGEIWGAHLALERSAQPLELDGARRHAQVVLHVDRGVVVHGRGVGAEGAALVARRRDDGRVKRLERAPQLWSDRTPSGVDADQKPSEAKKAPRSNRKQIRSTQEQSEAIRSNQKQSEAIRSNLTFDEETDESTSSKAGVPGCGVAGKTHRRR